MRKISDLSDKETNSLKNKLNSAVSSMGMDEYEVTYPLNAPTALGICSTCKSLDYCETEFDNVYARCNRFDVKLSIKQKMVRCTCVDRRGTMDLSDMKQIAILIDPVKKSAGFLKSEERK